ncbi:hypothetical protein Tco_1570717 [Tanacetum coccineum]
MLVYIFTQGKVSSISIGGSISSEGFLSSILLSVVIIVTVVFVVVVLVVVVIAIVGVVIVVVFGIIVVVVPLVPVFLLGLLALAIDAACAFRIEEMTSLISLPMALKLWLCFRFDTFWEAFYQHKRTCSKNDITSLERGYGMIHEDDIMSNGGNDIKSDKNGEWVRFLGVISSGIEKYRGLNSSDGGNIGDRVKIAGGVIGSGDEIEFSEELKELLPNETGK